MQTKLTKLAENPLTLSEDEDSMDYSKEADVDEELEKGKKVSGPRTKLSNSGDNITIAQLAKGLRAVAKSQAIILKHMQMADPPMGGGNPMAPQEDEFGADPTMAGAGGPPMGGAGMDGGMGGGDEFGDEDEFGGDDDLDLDMFGGEFDPYGQEQADPLRGGDVTMNRVPMQMSKAQVNQLAKAVAAVLRKDDSSSNFGEKDSDIVGNRELDPDDKDKSADEVLIQGGAGAGPGPVSKAVISSLAKAVAAELRTTRKSTTSPRMTDGGSQIAKAVDTESYDMDSLVAKAAGQFSFRDIAQMRIQQGDLSAGIL